MSPARAAAIRLLAGWTAAYVFGLAVRVSWRWFDSGSAPVWLGVLVGVAAFLVVARFSPPARRGRHRCR